MVTRLKLDKALRRANNKFQNGKLEEAKRIYQGILAEHPENKKALAGLNSVLGSNDKMSSRNLSPPQKQIQFLAGLYKQGKFVELLHACELSKQQFPNSLAILNILGLANSRLGRLEAAIETFEDALRISPDTPELHNNLGNAQRRFGDLTKAIDSFHRALKVNPSYIDAYYNIGSAYLDCGDPTSAIFHFEHALRLNPNYVEAHNNMGNALQRLDKTDAALRSYQRAIELQPTFFAAYNNIGNIEKRMGNLKSALVSYKSALAIDETYVQGYINLGNVLKEMGDTDSALENYRHALALNPNCADAYLSIGNALLYKGERSNEAVKYYRKALLLKPGYSEAYNNMGIAQEEIGNIDLAVDCYQRALELNPDYDTAYVNLGNILKGIKFTKSVNGLEDTVLKLLRRTNLVNPNDIAIATTSLLKCNPTLIMALEMVSDNHESLRLRDTIRYLVKVPLLIEFMSVSLIPDLEVENVFRTLRARILFDHRSLVGDTDVLTFSCRLALQCFTNEYIYSQSDKEELALRDMERAVLSLLESGQYPEPLMISCLASYKSLSEYRWSHRLKMPSDLSVLQIRQMVEPLMEKRLLKEISSLCDIEDVISNKVREQYEENPYPRWVKIGLPLRPKTIEQLASGLSLKISNPIVFRTLKPIILIAGGGTGQHTISSASRYLNAQILCIDLSLKSLAYAKRKTVELEVSNINYLQGDILALAKLGRQFDIIECSGVLHHMQDPMKGWKALIDRLNAGGLIRLGLYSEVARQHILRIRDSNQDNNIGSSTAEIKSFREMVKLSTNSDHKKIASSPDFYSLSTLRDLIFHVEEHRFNIPQLKSCLSELGLEFCGFDLGNESLGRSFRKEFGGKDDFYNLDKWHTFEKANPTAFAGMYQFWCQKVA